MVVFSPIQYRITFKRPRKYQISCKIISFSEGNSMFIQIITLTSKTRAFDELDLIRKNIIESVFPVLNSQDGWKKTDVIYNKETRQFKVISFWSSKRQAAAFDEEEPKLSSLGYMQVGKFAEYFENENLIVENFDHLETIEKSNRSEE